MNININIYIVLGVGMGKSAISPLSASPWVAKCIKLTELICSSIACFVAFYAHFFSFLNSYYLLNRIISALWCKV